MSKTKVKLSPQVGHAPNVQSDINGLDEMPFLDHNKTADKNIVQGRVFSVSRLSSQYHKQRNISDLLLYIVMQDWSMDVEYLFFRLYLFSFFQK